VGWERGDYFGGVKGAEDGSGGGVASGVREGGGVLNEVGTPCEERDEEGFRGVAGRMIGSESGEEGRSVGRRGEAGGARVFEEDVTHIAVGTYDKADEKLVADMGKGVGEGELSLDAKKGGVRGVGGGSGKDGVDRRGGKAGRSVLREIGEVCEEGGKGAEGHGVRRPILDTFLGEKPLEELTGFVGGGGEAEKEAGEQGMDGEGCGEEKVVGTGVSPEHTLRRGMGGGKAETAKECGGEAAFPKVLGKEGGMGLGEERKAESGVESAGGEIAVDVAKVGVNRDVGTGKEAQMEECGLLDGGDVSTTIVGREAVVLFGEVTVEVEEGVTAEVLFGGRGGKGGKPVVLRKGVKEGYGDARVGRETGKPGKSTAGSPVRGEERGI
jgi:hypothetical protein